MLLRKEGIVDSVKKEILGEEGMKGYWRELTNEADCSVRDELLIDIVSLYVTIRGFSLAACWLEQYKREKVFESQRLKLLKSLLIKVINSVPGIFLPTSVLNVRNAYFDALEEAYHESFPQGIEAIFGLNLILQV